MLKTKIFLFSFFFAFFQAFTQESEAKRHSQQIDTNRIKVILEKLASKEMEGRETGTEGQKRAAAYILQELIKSGVKNPQEKYYQRYPLVKIIPENISLTLGGQNSYFQQDFTHQSNFSNTAISNAKIQLLTNIERLNQLVADSNSVLLIADKNLYNSTLLSKELVRQISIKGFKAILILNNKGQAVNYYNDTPFESLLEAAAEFAIPVLDLNYASLEELYLLKQKKKLKKLLKQAQKTLTNNVFDFNIDLSTKIYSDTVYGENVIAFIPGNKKPEEIIVLMAHYDHLGKKGNDIFYGADDNASGTAALLEITRIFSLIKNQGEGFERSLLVLFVSGEEKGLLGSQFFCENPWYSIDKMQAALNIDMIGRIDQAHVSQADYVYVIGSDFINPKLHLINEKANQSSSNLFLDYRYNSLKHPERLYFRSDHYNFAQRGVPSIFYFSGLHEDYHRSSDTSDKINYLKVKKITELVFYTTWELLNNSEPLR